MPVTTRSRAMRTRSDRVRLPDVGTLDQVLRRSRKQKRARHTTTTLPSKRTRPTATPSSSSTCSSPSPSPGVAVAPDGEAAFDPPPITASSFTRPPASPDVDAHEKKGEDVRALPPSPQPEQELPATDDDAGTTQGAEAAQPSGHDEVVPPQSSAADSDAEKVLCEVEVVQSLTLQSYISIHGDRWYRHIARMIHPDKWQDQLHHQRACAAMIKLNAARELVRQA